MCRATGLHGSEGAWGWQQPPATRLGVGEGSTGHEKEAVVAACDGLRFDAGAFDIELATMAGERDVPCFTFMDEREGLLLRVEFEEGRWLTRHVETSWGSGERKTGSARPRRA